MGVLAGYFGKWVDTIISRFIDVLLAFPGLLLAITIVAILGPGTQNTMYAIAIFRNSQYLPYGARLRHSPQKERTCGGCHRHGQ